MKNKILICLFIILFGLTGCIFKKNENATKNISNKTEVKENQLMIGGYDLTLTKNGTFDKLSFKYPENTTVSSIITSMILTYSKKESDQPLFKIAMGQMYGTNVDDVMTGFTKTGNITINNINWTIYDDGSGHHQYACNNGYDIYVISFILEDGYSQLEDELMKTVTLNV